MAVGKIDKGLLTDDFIQKIYQQHKSVFGGGQWTAGVPVEHWIDEYGDLCIRYESGAWWHYYGVTELGAKSWG